MVRGHWSTSRHSSKYVLSTIDGLTTIGDFLRCALDKAATQLLWDVGARENVNYEQLVDRLRQRYGVEGQAETFGFSSIIDANVLMRLSTRHSPSRSIGVSSSL